LHALFPGHIEKPTLITGHCGVQKIFMFNFVNNFIYIKKTTFLPTSDPDSQLRDHFCTHNHSSHFQNLSHHFLVNFNLSCKQLSFFTAVCTFLTCTSVFIITRQWCHWLFSTFFYERHLVPFKHIRSWEGIFSICLMWYIKGLGGTVHQFQKRLQYLLITNFFFLNQALTQQDGAWFSMWMGQGSSVISVHYRIQHTRWLFFKRKTYNCQ